MAVPSYATVDATKLEMTPMRVSYQGPGAGAAVDLGSTLSHVVVDIKYTKGDLKADQMGSTTVMDRRVTGTQVMVTTELAEVQNKDLWKVIFPHAKEITSGSNKAIEFQSMVGDADLTQAGALALHPLSKADSDLSGDFKFFKVCASAESSITYGPDKQAVLKIVWNVLPDTSVSPARFFIHGDSALAV